MKNKINIGTASIILIFIILCLSVFALLGLSDAKTAEVFARRHAASVSSYYKTDAFGQYYIKTVSESIKNGTSSDVAVKDGTSVLPEGTPATTSVNEPGNLICEIPMSSGQSLHIELDKNDASVLAYYVYNSEDYAIDNRMPVWTGQ